jgi:hypothetical protein
MAISLFTFAISTEADRGILSRKRFDLTLFDVA